MKPKVISIRAAAALILVVHVLNLALAAEDPASHLTGRWVRVVWYERGIEHGNPDFNSRFRVNAPEAVVHPTFKNRPETRGNGMMLIRADEDATLLEGAELYAEIWGGHPGTANKRLIVNGRSIYPLPEVGVADKQCAHQYPLIPLKPTDLVNGYNAIQFACDRGTTFWGHFIVDNAALRLTLGKEHPILRQSPFRGFDATVQTRTHPDNPEIIELGLQTAGEHLANIARIDYYGHYRGYDENGDGAETDWHGFTKARRPVAILGSVDKPPFSALWDIQMLPAQSDVMVRAVVHFKDHPEVRWLSPAAGGLRIGVHRDAQVTLARATALPKPFWSRAGRTNRCEITLDMATDSIERAELHVVVWDGGAGKVANYFSLNGHPLAVAGRGRHDVIYSIVDVDKNLLKNGPNAVELLSDTEHHGIEVLLPGPALIVRHRKGEAAAPQSPPPDMTVR